ncbi:MAG: glycoside hydrolase family 3 protein [Lachnospiraceae bacterium]|nr:glycoside hydrolase family 3 protein [Lachnospiraceae bacterium]
MIDYKASPFFLDDADIQWVEDTYASMSLHEKACQLFFDPLAGMNREQLKDFLAKYPIAGMSFRGAQFPLEETQDILRELQATARIPYMIASDTEAGANAALRGGTFIASSAQAGAADDPEVAYHVTASAAAEIKAAGYNMSFGAVCDPLLNWRNSLINIRSYGRDKDLIIRCCDGFIKGFEENNMISCLKHFPGDGWEERDQHLVIANNGLSCEEWDALYGDIYTHFIQQGVRSIMVGHFTLPSYQRYFNPDLKDEDMLPATLSPELINGLLRTKLGYNGLVFTDQTKMLGYYAMKRTDAVVQSIVAGLDFVLGINDIEEDVAAMTAGILDGRITPERLHDAICRTLATKASIGLHTLQKEGCLVPPAEALAVVGCAKHKQWAVEASDAAITLVKDVKHQLPIRPETHKRLFLNIIGNAATKDTMAVIATGGGASQSVKDMIADKFREAGFEVDIYEEKGFTVGKGKTKEFAEKYDAAIIIANLTGFAMTNSVRINWGSPMSNGCPWYAPEIPTAFISLNYTNHMCDVPRVPIFINAYNDKPYTIDLLIQKLMGNSPFRGSYNENVWCGMWDTHFGC